MNCRTVRPAISPSTMRGLFGSLAPGGYNGRNDLKKTQFKQQFKQRRMESMRNSAMRRSSAMMQVGVFCAAAAMTLAAGSSVPAQAQTDEALAPPTITTFEVAGSGTAGGQGTVASGINDGGTIVGAYLDSGGVAHAFIRANGVDTTFAAPGAGTGK